MGGVTHVETHLINEEKLARGGKGGRRGTHVKTRENFDIGGKDGKKNCS